MSKVCDICGKSPVSGNSISHAHNVNLRKFKPNLRSVKENGVSKTICMKCLKTASKVR